MSASFLCLYGHIEGRRSRFLGVSLVSPLDTPTCTAAHRVHSLGDARVQVGGLDAVRRARPARRGGGCVQPRVQWGGGRGGGGGASSIASSASPASTAAVSPMQTTTGPPAIFLALVISSGSRGIELTTIPTARGRRGATRR